MAGVLNVSHETAQKRIAEHKAEADTNPNKRAEPKRISKNKTCRKGLVSQVYFYSAD